MPKVIVKQKISYKSMNNQEFIDLLNKEYPIKIRKLAIIIDRIHEKFPYIEKSEIALIVKTFFIVFRNFFVNGKPFRMKGYIGLMKFLVYRGRKNRNGTYSFKEKTQINTLNIIKKGKDDL